MLYIVRSSLSTVALSTCSLRHFCGVSVALAVQLVRFCYLIFRSYKLSKTERQSAAGDANDKKKK